MSSICSLLSILCLISFSCIDFLGLILTLHSTGTGIVQFVPSVCGTPQILIMRVSHLCLMMSGRQQSWSWCCGTYRQLHKYMSLLCSLPLRLWSWNMKDAFSLYTCAPGLGTRDSSMKNNLFLIWEDWCTTGTSSPILVPSYGRAKETERADLWSPKSSGLELTKETESRPTSLTKTSPSYSNVLLRSLETGTVASLLQVLFQCVHTYSHPLDMTQSTASEKP